jgi:plasmid stabilization system protein ParE
MFKFRILSAASRDLTNAVEYYETQSCGLGRDFLDEFENTVSRVCRFPDAWASVSPGLRRCLMRRFPYAVFYSRNNEEIIISGVADLRMNPENVPK